MKNRLLPGLNLEQQVMYDHLRANYINAHRSKSDYETRLLTGMAATTAALDVREMVSKDVSDDEIFNFTPLIDKVKPGLTRGKIVLIVLSNLALENIEDPAQRLTSLYNLPLRLEPPVYEHQPTSAA